jgi:hypothetical protein
VNEVFQTLHDDKLGSFVHETLTLQVNLSADEVQAVIEELEADPSGDPSSMDEARGEAALKATTLYHEIRHYYDCFGTLAGLSLFDASMQLLTEFVFVCRDLAGRGEKWRLPLRDWISDASCPASVRAFAIRARGLRVASRQFLGSYRPITIPGHREEVYILVPDEHGSVSVPAFPMAIGVDTSVGRGLWTVLYPIGFETLIEGSARAVERSIIGSSFGSELADSLVQKHWTVSQQPGSVIEPSDVMLPYNITDLVVSKYCDGRAFPRDVILALTDMTLSMATIRRLNSAALQVDVVGRTFLDRLHSFSADEIVRGEVRHPAYLTLAYEAGLRAFESGPTLEDTIKRFGSRPDLANMVELWKTFAVQSIAVPLLEYRVATDHAAFTTVTGFLQALETLSLPPFIASNDGLSIHGVPDAVLEVRGMVIMASTLMRQIVADREVILCPRAHALTPGLDVEEFALEGSCSEFASAGTCGSWYLGRAMKLPACVFRNVLDVSRVGE